MGVVSCDSNGKPTAGLVLATEFKVTNGTVTEVSLFDESGKAFEKTNLNYTIAGGKVTFSEFKNTLPETTRIVLKAKYKDGEGNELIEGDSLVYTIAKLKVAEASTVVDFSNDNIIIPCDENGTMLATTATTYVAMMHGDEVLGLNLETPDNNIYSLSSSASTNGYYKLDINLNNCTFTNDVCNVVIPFIGAGVSGTYNRTGQVILSKVKAGESGHIWDLVMSTDNPKFNNDTDEFDVDYIEGWVNIWSKDGAWTKATYGDLAKASRYIVFKATTDDAEWTELNDEIGFVGDNFRIYINPIEKDSKLAYADIDTSKGVTIALAQKDGDNYIPIQEEIVRASFDGRDFSKFELMLSDSVIYKTYRNGELVKTSPENVVSLVGIYEHNGLKRDEIDLTDLKFENSKLHNKYISGLDVYYGFDKVVSVDNLGEFTPLTDNDGVINESIAVDGDFEKLDVLLVALYDSPDDEGNNPKPVIVDHKELKVVRVATEDGKDGKNTKHLESSNPFAIVYLDPDNKVLKSEEV